MSKEKNTESQEYGLLQHIKMCLDCNNESQALRIIEKYGFEKQENMYSKEQVIELLMKFNQEEVENVREWFEENKKK